MDGRLPVAPPTIRRRTRRPANTSARDHSDQDDDRDLWLRGHGHTIRRYGDKQLTQQPNAVIEDLLYAGAGVPLKL